MNDTLHIMRFAHDAVYRPFFRGIPPSTEKLLQLFLESKDFHRQTVCGVPSILGVYLHPPKNYYSYSLSFIFNAIKTPKSQFDVNVANRVAIDFANNVLPVWWMEVYPLRFNQSKSLLHAETKWYNFEL